MAHLPSLPDESKLVDVFRLYPDTARPLLDYHEALMRGPSPLTVAQRELIAAYVSGLNACGYCHGVHRVAAEAFGIQEETLSALLEDVSTDAIDEPMRVLLRYVEKLTREPSSVTPGDAAAVLRAGWDERALHDAVAVCALFNLMNRYVDGLGITAGADYFDLSGHRVADIGYAGLKDLL
jgi:uncharacterized peroxidase-related enzyme